MDATTAIRTFDIACPNLLRRSRPLLPSDAAAPGNARPIGASLGGQLFRLVFLAFRNGSWLDDLFKRVSSMLSDHRKAMVRARMPLHIRNCSNILSCARQVRPLASLWSALRGEDPGSAELRYLYYHPQHERYNLHHGMLRDCNSVARLRL